MASLSLDLGLQGTHVVVTGGAGLIGRVVVDHFVQAGAIVSSLDISHSPEQAAEQHAAYTSLYCDVSSEQSVRKAFHTATKAHGPVAVCIALASLDLSVLDHASFVDASFAQLKRVLDVNIAGTWLTAREWLRGLRRSKSEGQTLENASLIIVGSESGHFGERLNAEYSLAKSAVQGGLLMSLRAEAVRELPTARVNAVAPGAVDTDRWYYSRGKDESMIRLTASSGVLQIPPSARTSATAECKENPEQYYLEAQATTALRKPIPPYAVAKTILFLASDNFSSHVHGQVVNVDGGKQGKVMWTKEEVA